MKYAFFVYLIFLATSCTTTNKISSKIPAVSAKSEKATFSISGEAPTGWNISPDIKRDTFLATCYQKTETVLFKTDKDSISFLIQAGQTKLFNVRLKDSVNALTVVYGIPPAYNLLTFSNLKNENANLKFWHGFQSTGYRDTLELLYPYSYFGKNLNDVSKISGILNWAHQQWKHNGGNTPKKNDAISILAEAKTGGQFPCFAFSIVLTAKLNAAGFKARVLYLKARDVETSSIVPGHVVTEVFIPSLNKWAFLDGQFNAMPVMNGIPLNAVEFQKALTENYDKVSYTNIPDYNGAPWSKRNYAEFVYQYLYFFDFAFDSRSGSGKINFIDGKKNLMLVPIGVTPPAKFGAFDGRIDYCKYTTSIREFYQIPE